MDLAAGLLCRADDRLAQPSGRSGGLAVELSVGILVWTRRLRRWVLAAGAVMHTMVMVTIAVGFFTPAVLVLYLAFAPPAIVERLPYSANYMATKLMAALRRPG